MRTLLSNLDGKQKVAILAFIVLTILGILAFTIESNIKQLIMVSSIILAILAIVIFVIVSKTKNSIRYYSLAILVITALLLTQQKTFIQKLFDSFLSNYFPQYMDKEALVEASPFLTQISIMIFVLIGIFIVNYFMRDNTAMGISKIPIDDVVPESSIKEQIERVVSALNDDLRSIDIKTNWSIHNFVPLDAEVEVSTGNRKQKRITNLLDAIQKSDDRLFLVLGDPGSGKSVSLRKLARELAEESEKTGKIPIYVNLKEWSFDNKNGEATVEDIKKFVLENILNRDIFITKFFKSYFDRLYEEGRLYFIFDSFDEMPMLLHGGENSEIVQHYSDIFFRFLKGARAESSQGVLASRFFRKPTREFQVKTTLEIRPFDDEKIITMFKNLGTLSEASQIELFKNRHDLVPVARNPFTAQLLSDYYEKNSHTFPSNQAQMYKSYIVSTLESCEEKIKRANLSIERIFSISMQIAQLMFEEHGFEISKSKLFEYFDRDEIEEVIHILKFSRLGRVGNDEGNFSFVHRRFAEYFIVEQMIESDDINISYEAIPEDSKWRDALVLYCEVANEEKVKKIANFCWNTIEEIGNPKDLRAIHTVRFLRDAFKSRKECLVDFEDELAFYINEQIIDEDNSTLQIKLAVESVGLLKKEPMDTIISNALDLHNYWISDTALRSCRHLSEISQDLVIGLKQYVLLLPVKNLLRNKKNIEFSFSLSSAFDENRAFLKKYLLGKYFDILFILILFFSSLTIFFGDIVYENEDRVIASLYLFFWGILQLIGFFQKSKLTFYQKFKIVELIPYTYIVIIHLGAGLVAIFLPILIKKDMLFSFSFMGIVIFLIFIFDYINNLHKIKENLVRLFLLLSSIITFQIIKFYMVDHNSIYNTVNFSFILIIFILILVLPFFLGLLFIIYDILKYIFIFSKDFFRFKKIFKNRLFDRSYIQLAYTLLKTDYFKIKLLNYIDTNYKEIKGEWIDESILKVSSNDADIYLAQLEEKWRGIEK